MAKDSLEVLDDGELLVFSFDDMLRYSGPGSPAGVALAFKVLQLALPLLDPDAPAARRELGMDTAFRGPGVRDGFELVTRAVTGGRYQVDARLERTDRGTTLAQFVFRPSYRARSLTLVVREGQVSEEFVALARKPDRALDEERRLTSMKQSMADRLMASPPADIFSMEPAPGLK